MSSDKRIPATREYSVIADELGRRCLRTGHPSGYTCLSDTQWVKLFGRRMTKPKRYGCGGFACVYQSDEPNKVIKLTRDPGDVHTTMAAQGIPGAVTLFSARKIADNEKRWAMRLEKLVPTAYSDKVTKGMRCARTPQFDEFVTPVRCCDMPMIRALQKAARVPASESIDSCHRLMTMVQQTQQAFSDRHLSFSDWHSGNIGRNAQGKWKILDLGYNVDEVEPRPLLDGARRSKKARRSK